LGWNFNKSQGTESELSRASGAQNEGHNDIKTGVDQDTCLINDIKTGV